MPYKIPGKNTDVSSPICMFTVHTNMYIHTYVYMCNDVVSVTVHAYAIH